MNSFEGITTWYERYEKRIGLLGVLGGFVVDSLTLRGSDQVLENIVLGCYLLVFASGIIITNRIEEKLPVEAKRGRIHFWINFFMSFVIGGLFSAFFVFYFRSSSFEVSFPFLLTLLIVMVGNELFKKQTNHMVFQTTIFFFALFSWSIFFVPTVLKHISVWTFVGSTLLTLILFRGFLWSLKRFVKERYQTHRKKILLSSLCLFVVIEGLYIARLIPPLPLVAKDVGVYQSISRLSDGSYKVTSQKETLRDMLSINPHIRVVSSGPLYVFSAVYSPADLDTVVSHVWARYDEKKKDWVQISKVNVPLVGGRTKGYRLYTMYPYVTEGLWRVDIQTKNGQIMKRVKFNVENVDVLPGLIEIEK